MLELVLELVLELELVDVVVVVVVPPGVVVVVVVVTQGSQGPDLAQGSGQQTPETG